MNAKGPVREKKDFQGNSIKRTKHPSSQTQKYEFPV